MQEYEAVTKREHIKLQQQATALQSKEEELLRLQVWRAYSQTILMAFIYGLFFRRVYSFVSFKDNCSYCVNFLRVHAMLSGWSPSGARAPAVNARLAEAWSGGRATPTQRSISKTRAIQHAGGSSVSVSHFRILDHSWLGVQSGSRAITSCAGTT